jgi:hypothetical protein
VYKFLNLFGEIMKYKILGEDEVRSLYAASNKNCYYTIVRYYSNTATSAYFCIGTAYMQLLIRPETTLLSITALTAATIDDLLFLSAQSPLPLLDSERLVISFALTVLNSIHLQQHAC